MPRFITKLEIKYDEKFPEDPSHASAYYLEFNEEPYFKLLEDAIKRDTPVTTEELIELHGGEESYLRHKAFLRANGYPNA